jgi:hypothetical protein
LELIPKQTLGRSDTFKPILHCADGQTVTLNFALDGGISTPSGNSMVGGFTGGEFAKEDAPNT